MVNAWRRPLAMWAVSLVVLGIGATFIEDEPASNVRLDITGAQDAAGPAAPGVTNTTAGSPAVDSTTTTEVTPTTVPVALPPGPPVDPLEPGEEPARCVPGTYDDERGSCQDRPWVLTGRITDVAGNGVAGICVTGMQGNTLATTRSDGSYRIEMDSGVNPPWTLHDCSTDPFGWIEQFVAARYAPGETTQYDVVMTRLAGIVGRVVDVDGNPVAGVCVGAPIADHRAPPEPWATGPDGRFRFGGVIPGVSTLGAGACPQQALYLSGEQYTFAPGQWTEVTLVVTLPGQVPPGGLPGG